MRAPIDLPDDVMNMSNPETPNADATRTVTDAALNSAAIGVTDATAAADGVLEILSGVEKQLDRLRDAKKLQDEQAAALAARQKALEQLQMGLDQSIEELREERSRLEADRSKLDRDRINFEDHWKQFTLQISMEQKKLAEMRERLDEETAAVAQSRDGIRNQQAAIDISQQKWEDFRAQQEKGLTKRAAEIESRAIDLQRKEQAFGATRERIEALEEQCRALEEQLAARSNDLDTDRAELLRRVEQAESNVGELVMQLEGKQEELDRCLKRLDQVGHEVASQQARIRELENALAGSHSADDRVTELESRLEAEADKREELHAQLAGTLTERDAALRELHDLQVRFDSAAGALDRAQAESQELAGRLEAATEQLGKFSKLLEEHAPQLERGASAIAQCEQQQKQIEELSRELVQLRQQSDPTEWKRRDERIEQLTDALRQARGQSVAGAGLDEVQAQNVSLAAEVDRLRLEVEKLSMAATSAQEQLEASRAAAASVSGDVTDSRIASYEAQVASLQAQLEQQSSEFAERSQQLLQKAQEADQAFSELVKESERATASSKREQEEASTKLRERVKTLEQELNDARKHAGGKGGKGATTQEAAQLREKAQRVAEVAEHLKRRRRRLARVRDMLEARVQAAESAAIHASVAGDESTVGAARMAEELELHAQAQREIEVQRQHLLEVRKALVESEQQMIAKWARPRAVATLGWLAMYACIVAAAAWLGAGQVAPPVRTASITIEPKQAGSGGPESTEELAAWRQVGRELLLSQPFHQLVAKRCGERRLEHFAAAGAVTTALTRDVSVDDSDLSALTLTMSSDKPDEMTRFLDVVASALSSEAGRQQGGRRNELLAIVPVETGGGAGQSAYATLSPSPVKDERLKVALIMFGAGLGFGLLVVGVLYVRLSRAKRVFDADGFEHPVSE